jgi:hypothetical protein
VASYGNSPAWCRHDRQSDRYRVEDDLQEAFGQRREDDKITQGEGVHAGVPVSHLAEPVDPVADARRGGMLLEGTSGWTVAEDDELDTMARLLALDKQRERVEQHTQALCPRANRPAQPAGVGTGSPAMGLRSCPGSRPGAGGPGAGAANSGQTGSAAEIAGTLQ